MKKKEIKKCTFRSMTYLYSIVHIVLYFMAQLYSFVTWYISVLFCKNKDKYNTVQKTITLYILNDFFSDVQCSIKWKISE